MIRQKVYLVPEKERNVIDDYKLSWATAAYFIGSVGNSSLKLTLPIPESLWPIISILVGIGIMFMFLQGFKICLRRSEKLLWRSILLFLGIYLFSTLLITQRGEPLDQMMAGAAFLTFAWWIPVGVFACSVCDKSILYDVWVKASYVLSLFSILVFLFHTPPEVDNSASQYSMTFGTNIILPLLIQINDYTRKRRLWLLCLILFEVFTLIVYANRGVLLSIIAFCVYKFAFESDSRLRKVLSSLFLIVVTIVMLSSIEELAKTAIVILDTFGFASRNLEMLALGVISDTSGRDDLWQICFEMIEERPILGWGLGGEYYQLGKMGHAEPGAILHLAFTPHNGIIQNFVCFGLIGGLLATVIVLLPLFNLKRYRKVHELLLIFACASVIPACISSDGFFTKPQVAIYLYLFYFANAGRLQLKVRNL